MTSSPPLSGRRLWALCGAIAAANLVLALLFPSLHGEGEPMPASIAGRCLLEGEAGIGALWTCLREGALNYGWTYYALSTAFAAVLGETYFGALALTATCFAAALGGTYRIAERLGGRRAGLFALALLCAYPIIPYYGRRVQFEMLQAALVAWFLVLLLRSDGLRRLGPALGMAAILAAGTWCKPSTAFFTAPAAALAWLLASGDGRARLRGLRGLAIVGLGLLPVVSFYRFVPGMWKPAGVVADHMVRSRLVFPYWDVDAGTIGGELRWVFYFVRMLSNYQVGLLLALLAGASLIAALRSRRRDELVLWSSYLAAATLHTFLAYKKFYYTMPALPAVAAVTAVWVTRVSASPRLRPARVVLLLLCAASVLRWQFNVYGPDDLVPRALHAAIGFNDPPAFHSEPPRFAPRSAAELPILLAIAEDEEVLRLLVLPRGGKIESLTTRPELYGFEHALTYEFERRRVPVRTDFAQHGASLLGGRVVFLYPPVGWSNAQVGAAQIAQGCLDLASGRNPDLTERTSNFDCAGLVTQYERLLPRLEVLHVGEFGPGRLRALAVIRDADGVGLRPRVAARALAYAEAMQASDQVPELVRTLAGQAPPAAAARAATEPLRFLRHGSDQRVFPH